VRRAIASAGFIVAVVFVGAAFGRAPASHASSCAFGGRSVDVTGSMPFGFPLPAKFRATTVTRGAANTTLVGFVPRPLAAASTFFQRAVPASGFEPTSGDAELGLEVESRFVGPFAAGRWRVNSIPGCRAWSVVTLQFARRAATQQPS
jgi:hypothetical protein